MLPKRRKPPKMGLNEAPQIRSAGHLKWIRGHECSVAHDPSARCDGKIEAAHVRTGTDGGTSVKPSDCWAIPLCSHHHRVQHQVGERLFEKRYLVSMKSIAEQLWQRSPHRPRQTPPDAGRSEG